jgi:phosphoribosyl 1,2-cyclic phosphodiesterase
MKTCVLASGSSGNSTYLESKESSILIDVGIPTRELQNRLSKIGKSPSEIDAIFITHEHSDHIKGVERLNKQNKVPVYLNRSTYEFTNLALNTPNFFKNDAPFEFNDLKITPRPLSHDAADPCGFKIESKGATIGILTDFGKANNKINETINQANCLILETNHDIDMLMNGPYPYLLKQRILSDKGHLSNIDSGLLIKNHASINLKTIFLAHLSKTNNTEELALGTFSTLAPKNKNIKPELIVAKQEENTEVISIK